MGLLLPFFLALAAGASEPRTGEKAPEFELPGTDGKTHRMEDFRRKQAVVIAWFPKAFTGG